MNYNKEINNLLGLLLKESTIKIELKEDFKQDFNTIINTAWQKPGEQQIVKILFANKDKILNDEVKGKQFLHNVFVKNKSLIQNNCTNQFVDSISSLTDEEITETVKYIKSKSIKENKMYKYYRVQYMNEAQTYVCVPPFAINTLMEHETVLGFALESKQIKTQKGVDYVIEVSEKEYEEVTTDLEGSWGTESKEAKLQDASINATKNKFDKVKDEKGASQSEPKKLHESKWGFLFEREDVCSTCDGTGAVEGSRCPECGGLHESKLSDFEDEKSAHHNFTSSNHISKAAGIRRKILKLKKEDEGKDNANKTTIYQRELEKKAKIHDKLAQMKASGLNEKLEELIDGNKSSLARMRKPENTPITGADGSNVMGNDDSTQHMTFTEDVEPVDMKRTNTKYKDPYFVNLVWIVVQGFPNICSSELWDRFLHNGLSDEYIGDTRTFQALINFMVSKGYIKPGVPEGRNRTAWVVGKKPVYSVNAKTNSGNLKEVSDYNDPVLVKMRANQEMKAKDSEYQADPNSIGNYKVGSGKFEDTAGYKELRDFYAQYGVTPEEVEANPDMLDGYGAIKESLSEKIQREIDEAEMVSVPKVSVEDPQAERKINAWKEDGEILDKIVSESAAWDKATGKFQFAEDEYMGDESMNGHTLYENDTADMAVPDMPAYQTVEGRKRVENLDVYGTDSDEEYLGDEEVLQEKFIKFVLRNCQNAEKHNHKGKFNLQEFLNTKTFGFIKLLESEFKKTLREDETNGEFEIDDFNWQDNEIEIGYYYPSDKEDRIIKVSSQEFFNYLESTDPNWEEGMEKTSEGDRVDGESVMTSGSIHNVEAYWYGYSTKQQASFIKSFLIAKRGVSKKL
ncbi:MAG: hypothetical protein ABIP51_07835 [Bacteroidia bacterium]